MLEINIPTIIFEIINFIALSAILYWLLLKPGLKKIKARNEEKLRVEKEIEENRQIAEDSRIEWERKLDHIEDQITEIVEKNRKMMETEREELLVDVREEARSILEAARLESKKKQERSMSDFQDNLLDAIIEISAQVIGKAAPDEVHNTLLTQMNERIWQLGRDEMSRVETVRRSLDKRRPTAYVSSARELSPEQQSQFMRTLSALADSEIHLELSIEPELAAGIRLRIGDIVLDNCIASQLEEFRQDIKESISDKVFYD